MQCRIEHLVVIAGPTGAGKSTLRQEIHANRLSEVGIHLGIDNLWEWPRVSQSALEESTESVLKGAIVEWVFFSLDRYRRSEGLSEMLKDACEISFVTIWTPPVRLEHQFISKYRNPEMRNFFALVKSIVFQCLPRPLISRVIRLPYFRKLVWWLPRSYLKYELNTLEFYTQPDQVIQLYRRWFQSCDQWISKTRGHLIVEFDERLTIHSRDEWENRCSTIDELSRL